MALRRGLDAPRRLLALATQQSDLATVDRARAAVSAKRLRVFDPSAMATLAKRRRAEAVRLMERLERRFFDDRAVVIPPI